MPKITYDTASNYHDGVSEEFADVMDDAIDIAEEHGILLKDITFNTDIRSPSFEDQRSNRKVGSDD